MSHRRSSSFDALNTRKKLHGKGDLTGCVATLEDLERRQRRVLGPNHPQTAATEKYLASVRALIRKLSLSSRDA